MIRPLWLALVSVLLAVSAGLAQRFYVLVNTGHEEPAALAIPPVLLAGTAVVVIGATRGRYLKMLPGRELLLWAPYLALGVILPLLGATLGHYRFSSIYSLMTPVVAASALVLGATLQAAGKRGLSVLALPILIVAIGQAVYAVIQQLIVGNVLRGGLWDALLRWDATTQGAFGNGLVFARSSGFYVNPNILGVWAGVLMLAGLAIIRGRSRYILAGATLTTLLLSQSRGSAVALATGLGFMYLLARRRGAQPSLPSLVPYAFLTLGVVAGWAVLVSLGTPAGSLVGRVGQGIGVLGGGSDPSVIGRFQFWDASLHLLLAHPFGTLGPPETLLGTAVDSEWVRALLQGGPLYLLALGLALLGGAAIFGVDNHEGRAIRACCVFLAVAGISQLPMEYPPVYVFWAILGGVLVERRVLGAVPVTNGLLRRRRASMTT